MSNQNNQYVTSYTDHVLVKVCAEEYKVKRRHQKLESFKFRKCLRGKLYFREETLTN